MINIMIVGLPGNMATVFAKQAAKAKDISIIPYSITGPEVEEKEISIFEKRIELLNTKIKSEINVAIEKHKPFIAVDFTEPQAVEKNIELYCKKEINFVMGTTGVVMSRISQKIAESGINAVIAPNMAKQIVAFQAMMEFASTNFPNCFSGYSLEITESHQNGKLDTSGTARTMVAYFNRLGINYSENQIIKIRDPKKQLELGVPESALSGHGWHKYSLSSPDKNVFFEFIHNVNGRDVYAEGTLDSIRYLNKKIENGEKGHIFTMIDVLKNS
jgi:4-hydroxy-tetrahydrodipicolinate reductase